MGIAGSEVEPVDGLQRPDLLQRSGRERRPVIEGVQHDALEQIADRQIELGGECLQHFEQVALEAHARLGPRDLFHAAMVTWYQGTSKPVTAEFASRRSRSRCADAR